MRIRRIYSRLLLIGLLIVSMAAAFSTQPAAAQASNLLQNPGFDGDYTPFEGDLVRLVAPGWSAWNVPRKANEPSFIVVPEYRAISLPERTHSHNTAQGLQTFFGGYAGGVLQRVAVAAGTKLKFSAFINVWSSSLDDQAVSEEPSADRLEVGIDPTGGLDGTSANIVWAGVDNIYDQFRQVSVEATANGAMVTVFIKVTLLDPVAHNHAYFDDAELVITGEAPVPTAIVVVPTSTATSTNTLVALPTIAPSATPNAPTLEALITLTPSSTALLTNTPTTVVANSTPIPGIPTREGNLTPLPPRPSSTNTATSVAGQPTQVQPTATTVIGATPTLTVFDPVPTDLPDRILVTVAPGDTVSGLASRYGSTVDAITNANGLNNAGLILIGQQIVIPVPKSNNPSNPTPLPTFTPFTLVTVTPGGQDNGGGVVPAVSPTAPVSVIALTGPTVNGIGTYIVQNGDNFEAIAQRYNVTVRTLAALNGILNPKSIVIGQVLAAPGPGKNVPGGTRAPTVVPTVPAPNVRSYVVQPGDTLYRISVQFGVTTDAIMRYNDISNPNLIFVGQTLRIP